jgi:hypothetical protein
MDTPVYFSRADQLNISLEKKFFPQVFFQSQLQIGPSFLLQIPILFHMYVEGWVYGRTQRWSMKNNTKFTGHLRNKFADHVLDGGWEDIHSTHYKHIVGATETDHTDGGPSADTLFRPDSDPVTGTIADKRGAFAVYGAINHFPFDPFG